MTGRAVVIGQPVEHSRSPAIFRHWFARYGIAGDYGLLEVAPPQLEREVRRLAAEGYVGVNITIPHKERAVALASEQSGTVLRVGAANILTFREDGTIHADSSDGFGFLESIRAGAPSWDPAAGRAVVIGAGGAGRSIIDALSHAGVPEIFVLNRTLSRARQLTLDLEGVLTAVPLEDAESVLQDAALVINSTSLGMAGQPPLSIRLEGARSDAVVVDIVYAPRETPLLREARDTGRTAIPGTGMLLHQARPAFERWYGVAPRVDAELEAAVFGEEL